MSTPDADPSPANIPADDLGPAPVDDSAIESASAWILRVSVIASAVVMLIGVALSYWHGGIAVRRMQSDRFDYHLRAILRGILAGSGKSVIEAGIYLLVFTPIFRVAASMILFATRQRDWVYAAITLVVLVLTLAGLLWLG